MPHYPQLTLLLRNLWSKSWGLVQQTAWAHGSSQTPGMGLVHGTLRHLPGTGQAEQRPEDLKHARGEGSVTDLV